MLKLLVQTVPQLWAIAVAFAPDLAPYLAPAAPPAAAPAAAPVAAAVPPAAREPLLKGAATAEPFVVPPERKTERESDPPGKRERKPTEKGKEMDMAKKEAEAKEIARRPRRCPVPVLLLSLWMLMSMRPFVSCRSTHASRSSLTRGEAFTRD